MGTWKALEHTADLALEARGKTATEALEALCLGLAAQITDPATVAPRQTVELGAAGLDAAETLVAVLGELLYWFNVKGWVFSKFEVREVSEGRACVLAKGEPRDPSRHPFDLEIKAATYHDLYFGPDEHHGGWVARVIFDV